MKMVRHDHVRSHHPRRRASPTSHQQIMRFLTRQPPPPLLRTNRHKHNRLLTMKRQNPARRLPPPPRLRIDLFIHTNYTAHLYRETRWVGRGSRRASSDLAKTLTAKRRLFLYSGPTLSMFLSPCRPHQFIQLVAITSTQRQLRPVLQDHHIFAMKHRLQFLDPFHIHNR